MNPNFQNASNMAENREIIYRNPKLLKSFQENLQKFKEKKEESPPRSPQKPNVVTVPVPEVVPPRPLAAECKRPGKFTHPAVRWSLYALGGFLIIRWAWKKWKSDDDKDKD